MQRYCTNTEYTGSLGYNSVSDGVFREKAKQMYPVMREKQMPKRLGVVDVSNTQRIWCQPENTTLHDAQSRSRFAERGEEGRNKEKSSSVVY